MSLYRRIALQPDNTLRTMGPMWVDRGNINMPMADGEVQIIELDATRWLDAGETVTSVSLPGATVMLTSPRATITLTREPNAEDLTLTTSAGRVRKITFNAQGTRRDYGRVTV
jgi:hypothetical protein